MESDVEAALAALSVPTAGVAGFAGQGVCLGASHGAALPGWLWIVIMIALLALAAYRISRRKR
ncbi:hypothetical protein [Streptomyces canus]|uniref:hypothetical protein n=1 Tax=Streptomyces canus TaxID=58343 RepID=UPI002E2D29C4|nr:hypothetical protein [Streptomyces canus]